MHQTTQLKKYEAKNDRTEMKTGKSTIMVGNHTPFSIIGRTTKE